MKPFSSDLSRPPTIVTQRDLDAFRDATLTRNDPNMMDLVYTVERERELHGDVLAKFLYLLSLTPTEEGTFTFPDGDSWPASSRLAQKEANENQAKAQVTIQAHGQPDEVIDA